VGPTRIVSFLTICGSDADNPATDHPLRASEELQAALLTSRGQVIDTSNAYRIHPMRALLQLAWSSIFNVAHYPPQIRTGLEAVHASLIGRCAVAVYNSGTKR